MNIISNQDENLANLRFRQLKDKKLFKPDWGSTYFVPKSLSKNGGNFWIMNGITYIDKVQHSGYDWLLFPEDKNRWRIVYDFNDQLDEL